MPNAARARPSASVAVVATHGRGEKVQFCDFLFPVPPLLPPHITSVLVLKVVFIIGGGKNETSCVPEKLRKDGLMDGKILTEERTEEGRKERRKDVPLSANDRSWREQGAKKDESEAETNGGRGE